MQTSINSMDSEYPRFVSGALARILGGHVSRIPWATDALVRLRLPVVAVVPEKSNLAPRWWIDLVELPRRNSPVDNLFGVWRRYTTQDRDYIWILQSECALVTRTPPELSPVFLTI